MSGTKRLTVSAMAVALGVMFLVIGAAVDILDLSAAALSSVIAMFVYIEIGSPYTWLVWLSTSLLSFVLYSGSTVWLVYLVIFGLYPIVKGYIERTGRVLWLILKLVFVNVELVLLMLGTEFIIGVPFFLEENFFGLPTVLVKSVLWAGMNIAFLLYDYFLTVMARFYVNRLQRSVHKILR